MSEVLGKPIPEDFVSFLRNGVILCELVNTIQPGLIPASVVRTVPSKMSPFQVARSFDNVRHFLKVLPLLGVPETTLCSPGDLVEGKDVNKFINCVYNLGRICGTNGKTVKMPAPAAQSAARSANVRSIFGEQELTGPFDSNEPVLWYHKDPLDKSSAAILVKANGTAGCFIIYPERNNTKQFNLTMLLPSGLHRQFRIQTFGTQFSLGGTRFASLNKLVDHHTKWPLADGQTLNPTVQVIAQAAMSAEDRRKSVISLAEDDDDIKRQIQSAHEVESSANKLKSLLEQKTNPTPADLKQLETLDTTIRSAQAKIVLLQRALGTETSSDTYQDAKLLKEAIAVLDAQQETIGDDEDESGIPHNFRVRTFLSPKFCDHCAGFIYGLARQGLKCRTCGFVTHKRCREHVSHNCINRPDAAVPQSPSAVDDSSDTESLAEEAEPEDITSQRSIGKAMDALIRDFWKSNTQGAAALPVAKFMRLLEIAFPRVDLPELQRRFKSLTDDELGSLGVDQFMTFYKVLFINTHSQGLFEAYATFNGETLSAQEFRTFLTVEQKLSATEIDAILALLNSVPLTQAVTDATLLEAAPVSTGDDVETSALLEPTSVLHHLKNSASWHAGHRVFGPVLGVTSERRLTIGGFLNYLVSDVNSSWLRAHTTVYQDMTQPLSAYFINSSHNTYLEGDQLRSNSTAEAYAKALQAGCRCLELDLWEGAKDEPVIYHGYTLTTKVAARDVVEAIAKNAFVASDYPLLLSLENHLGVRQQRVFAQYCIDLFGDKLVTAKDGWWETNPSLLPSPQELRGKIIIKNKAHSSRNQAPLDPTEEDEAGETGSQLDGPADGAGAGAAGSNNRASMISDSPSPLSTPGSTSSMSLSRADAASLAGHGGKQKKQLKIAQEMSDVVVYTKSVPFQSFEHSKKTYKCYEMSSFPEKKARKVASRQTAAKLTYHTNRFLMRVYPDGMRFDSSNYLPQEFWNYGVQMSAINFQTPDRAMQLNEGKFLQNGNAGYILKPKYMREFADPEVKAPAADSGVHKTTLTIELLSGHQLPRTRRQRRRLLDPYVEVEIVGQLGDDRKFSSSTVFKNGYNPVWDEAFEFEVMSPELALVRFVVMDESVGPKEIVGQYTIPLESLRQGFHHLPLKRPQPFAKFDLLHHSSLFVKVTIQN
ncbi:PLCH2 protein, variant [Capsaspora owczarzaki ATCC 30864]|nr:PLCH2 protein, variant [Capsaspora owczarzaki ATCC 30864]